MAAAPGKNLLLLFLLPALSLALDSCMQEVLLLREQMEVEKVAMESKLDKMAANIERLEAEAAQAKVKSAEMQAEAGEIQAATAKLVRGQALASQPEVMVCSYRLSWTDTGTITYSKILTQFDNCDQSGGGCGSMDIGSGIFTAITPGMATIIPAFQLKFVSVSPRNVLRHVLWSICAVRRCEGQDHPPSPPQRSPGEFLCICLCLCLQVTESLWQSYCGEGCGRINDQASRTLVRE